MSKFKSIFQAVAPEAQRRASQSSRKRGSPASIPTTAKPLGRARGRPPGKRSNPQYRQITAYIRTDTHEQAKKALLDQKKELSELLEELLSQWLKSNK